MMVGARRAHHRLAQNITVWLISHFRRAGSECRVFDETLYLKDRPLDAALLPRDRAHVEVMDRQDGVWSGLQVLYGLGQMLILAAIGVSVPLAEIYRDVIEA